jgi:quercetin dioxygenase-like cupin family protein
LVTSPNPVATIYFFQTKLVIVFGGVEMDPKVSSYSSNPSGQAVSLVDQIAYQEGSVVSRTLIDKTSGTVTLFAFDKGQGLSEHKTPFDALVYIIDGEAEIVISGKSRLVKNGEVIIMPASEPHALRGTQRFKMMLVMIKS